MCMQDSPTSRFNPIEINSLTWANEGLNRTSGILNLSAPISIVLFQENKSKRDDLKRGKKQQSINLCMKI